MVSDVKSISIFVSSPGDLQAERDLVVEICAQLNSDLGSIHGFVIDARKWETHTYSDTGSRSQEVITAQIGSYDIYLGIMGFYFGTPTGTHGSGTEEEFDGAIKENAESDRPIVQFYFSSSKVELDRVNLDQYKKVKDFRGRIGGEGVYYRKFENLTQFEIMVRKGIISAVYKLLENPGELKEKSRDVVQEYRSLRPYEVLKEYKRQFETDPDVSSHILMQEATHNLDKFNKSVILVGKKTNSVSQAVAAAGREMSLFLGGNGKKKKMAIKSFERALDMMEDLTRWISYEIITMQKDFSLAISDFQRAGLIIKSKPGGDMSGLEAAFGAADFASTQLLSLAETIAASGSSIPELPDLGGRWEGNRKAYKAISVDFAEFLRIAVESLEKARRTVLES